MTNQVAITMLKNLEQSLDDYCELNDEGKEAFHMAITALELFGNSEQLPSVQLRKGKWIGYNADDKDWQRDDGSPVFMNCSECHEAVINNGSAHWNFCPNCGRRMEEGDSE